MPASRVLAAAFLVLVAALVTAATAGAKTYEVNKRADHTPNGCKKKDCSLREAILAANARDGFDRVVLPEKKTYNLAIENADPNEDAAATGDLDVSDPLLVTHPGKGRAKVDANGIDRVFELLNGGSTTFKKIVIRSGDDAEGDDDGGGGGIQAHDADLTLRRSSVSNNNADDTYGGGVELDGDSDLTMLRSAMNGNVSDSDSGAIEGDGDAALVMTRSKLNGNVSDGDGGAIYLDGSDARIVQTTIAGNRANGAGGINGNGALSIDRSTIANNVATSGSSGGIETGGDPTTITNSTIAGNRADEDGGGIEVNGPLALNAGTIVRNSSGEEGGGLFADTSDDIEVENSLIALNQAATAGDDCAGDPFESLGHNLLGTATDCEGFDASGDFVNANPKLGLLKNNGGPTQTVALKKGSPAINKAGDSAPNKDQRGEKRGKKPDIGAYERVKKKKKKGRR
jgi:CSLREA domain-containing protein